MNDPQAELATLYHAEYGQLTDLIMRSVGITAGGLLLFMYTGWAGSYLWGCIFVAVHAVQYPFLRSRLTNGKRVDAIIGGCLFVLVHISFIWLPTYLAAQSDRNLMLVGLLVLVATAMYHLKRADTQLWLVLAQVVTFASSLVFVSGTHLLRSDQALVQLGIAMVTIMAVAYIGLTMFAVHRQQMELRAANEKIAQEEKMSAIGRLTGGVAHDFNNILTVVKGNLEIYGLLNDDVEKEKVLAEAEDAAGRAITVVAQLLAFARKSRLQPESICMQEFLFETKPLLARALKENVELHLQIEDNARVSVDKSQFTAALLNLAINSGDAMPKGGDITISVRSVSQGNNSAKVEVCVTDTGGGIPKKLLDQVTEPFFTTKPVGEGSGLGLSMVKGFAEQSGGEMLLASDNQGTSVTIVLPSHSIQ